MAGPDDQHGAAPGGPWPADPWGSGHHPPGPRWSAAVAGPGQPAIGPTGPGPGSSWAGGSPAQARPGAWASSEAYPGAGAAAEPVTAAEGSMPERAGLDPAKLFGIVIAVLGALNFVFGFLPQLTSNRIDSLSVYAVGPAYVPILLLIAGLLALAAFLPGSERSRLAVAAVSVGGAVGAVISLGTDGPVELLTSAQVSKGMGAVLLAIFGLIQAVVAIGAYVVGADLRPRASRSVTITPDAPGSASARDGRFAPGAPSTTMWTDQGPVRSDPWSPTPPSGPPPGPFAAVPVQDGTPTPPRGAPPVPADTRWAPPADDDRPTGPQRVVDPAGPPPGRPAGTPAVQTAAERELPRTDPVEPDGASASIRSRHAADTGGWPLTGPSPAGPEPSGPPTTITPAGTPSSPAPPGTAPTTGDGPTPPTPHGESATAAPNAPDAPDAPTEIYRIPPRSGD